MKKVSKHLRDQVLLNEQIDSWKAASKNPLVKPKIPLCLRYEVMGECGKKRRTCPVKMITKEDLCQHTPAIHFWRAVVNREAHIAQRAAQYMVDFLEDECLFACENRIKRSMRNFAINYTEYEGIDVSSWFRRMEPKSSYL